MENAFFTRAMVREFGDIRQILRLEQVVLPALAEGQVRVKMAWATINPSDVITLSGAYRSRITLPFVPGFEGMGYISHSAFPALPPGQRVLPLGSQGAWQQYKDSDPHWCFTLPDQVSDRQAATGYVNPMTALLMLSEALDNQPGMRILINAANSAIGKMLVRIAHFKGMQPRVVVRRAQHLTQFDESITGQPFNSSSRDYPQALARLRQAGGVDAILDCVGGDAAVQLASALKPSGQFIHYGLLSGQPIPARFWRERPDIRSSHFHLRQWIHSRSYQEIEQRLDEVMMLIHAGVIATDIAAEFALADLPLAAKALLSGELQGKI